MFFNSAQRTEEVPEQPPSKPKKARTSKSTKPAVTKQTPAGNSKQQRVKGKGKQPGSKKAATIPVPLVKSLDFSDEESASSLEDPAVTTESDTDSDYDQCRRKGYTFGGRPPLDVDFNESSKGCSTKSNCRNSAALSNKNYIVYSVRHLSFNNKYQICPYHMHIIYQMEGYD